MNSSQLSLIASGLSILVGALVLASAQTRVLRRPPPRRVAYVVAWLVCAIVLGAFRTLGDNLVGRVGTQVALTNFAWMATVSAASLFVADAIAMRQFFRLAAMHAAVVTLLSLV